MNSLCWGVPSAPSVSAGKNPSALQPSNSTLTFLTSFSPDASPLSCSLVHSTKIGSSAGLPPSSSQPFLEYGSVLNSPPFSQMSNVVFRIPGDLPSDVKFGPPVFSYLPLALPFFSSSSVHALS